MNHEIPKPLRKALARQAPADVHPSADVLTSFMERTLSPAENEVVTHHLAQCAECREIVFLASNAAEEEVEEVHDQQELVAVAASGRVAAMPAYATTTDTSRPLPARIETPRSSWPTRMRWAVPVVAAVVIISAGVVLRFWRASDGHKPAPTTVASNRPSPASPQAQLNAPAANQQEAAPSPSFALRRDKAAPRAVPPALAKKAPPQGTSATTAELSSAPAPEAAPKSGSAEAKIHTLGAMDSAVVREVRPKQSLVETEPAQQQAESVQQDKSAQQAESAQKSASAQPPQLQQRAPALFGKPMAGMHAVSEVRPQWRIGPTGHLERSIAANQWTRVLDDQPVIFHAVAVIGSDVWAGGNGGALFHSSDSGEHWSKVSLAANAKGETGAIVSIRFDDAQHGTVASDSGARWATKDGGVTWTPE